MGLVTNIVMIVSGVLALTASAYLAQDVRDRYDRFQEEMFRRHSISIEATVVHMQERQDWKYEDSYERTSWGVFREREPGKTLYVIDARWYSPSANKSYTFHLTRWKNGETTVLSEGERVPVLVDSRDPTRYREAWIQPDKTSEAEYHSAAK